MTSLPVRTVWIPARATLGRNDATFDETIVPPWTRGDFRGGGGCCYETSNRLTAWRSHRHWPGTGCETAGSSGDSGSSRGAGDWRSPPVPARNRYCGDWSMRIRSSWTTPVHAKITCWGRSVPKRAQYVLGCLRKAIETWQAGKIDAIVFAPLNKQAMKLAGMKQSDELHYFADLLGHEGRVSEINICGKLWTSRVTSHIPLSAVSSALTADGICGAVDLLHQALRASGISVPRIAVAA